MGEEGRGGHRGEEAKDKKEKERGRGEEVSHLGQIDKVTVHIFK